MFPRAVRITGMILGAVAVLGIAVLLLYIVRPDAFRWLTGGTFETGGLVFVESPEVYTRQRLVNDRYQQDAWLQSKLAEIDSAALIARTERSAVTGRISAAIGGSDAGTPDDPDAASPQPDAVAAPEDLPFGPKFELQSSLRDKIRQSILENALDDRHDLSGNTVFGLKFDTAVVPGRNTWSSPTVVVKIAGGEIDQLRSTPARAADLYIRAPYIDPARGAPEDRDAVQAMNRYFNRWRGNLERRLNDHMTDLGGACTPAEPGVTLAEDLAQRGLCSQGADPVLPACPAAGDGTTYEDWFASTPICDVAPPPTSGGTFRIVANTYATETLLPAMLPQAASLNEAIEFKLRVPPRQADYGADLVSWIQRRAENHCNQFNTSLPPEFFRVPANESDFTRANSLSRPLWVPGSRASGGFDPTTAARSVADFISTLARVQESSPPAPLPGPWGSLFRIQSAIRPPGGAMCSGAAIDIRLLDREIGMMIVEGASSELAQAVLPAAGWSVLRCLAPACTEEGVTVWVERTGAAADDTLEETLDEATLQELIHETRPEAAAAAMDDGEKACTRVEQGFELQFGKLDAAAPWYYVTDRSLPDGVAASFADLACINGRSLQVKLGAYRFMRRMTDIDSYTYAAFPRGDVSGVVSEADHAAGLSLTAPVPGAPGTAVSTDISAETSASEVEARPSIINFATGGGNEAFDFGWMIVKDGQKRPMLASQVVLLSVPAYLEEIELSVWRGFIDLDRAAAGGDEDGGNLDSSNAVASRQIEAFTRSQSPTVMRLRVPPDYTALDGIIIGNDVLSGPQIQTTGDYEMCHRMSPQRDFSIAITGDRLWRSTVVTLDGVKADRIEVMPNMGGILAIFAAPRGQDDEPAPQNAVYLPGEVPSRSLTVWTSEGSDSREIRTCGEPAPAVGATAEAVADAAPAE